jgi:hypothetical protein
VSLIKFFRFYVEEQSLFNIGCISIYNRLVRFLHFFLPPPIISQRNVARLVCETGKCSTVTSNLGFIALDGKGLIVGGAIDAKR